MLCKTPYCWTQVTRHAPRTFSQSCHVTSLGVDSQELSCSPHPWTYTHQSCHWQRQQSWGHWRRDWTKHPWWRRCPQPVRHAYCLQQCQLCSKLHTNSSLHANGCMARHSSALLPCRSVAGRLLWNKGLLIVETPCKTQKRFGTGASLTRMGNKGVSSVRKRYFVMSDLLGVGFQASRVGRSNQQWQQF